MEFTYGDKSVTFDISNYSVSINGEKIKHSILCAIYDGTKIMNTAQMLLENGTAETEKEAWEISIRANELYWENDIDMDEYVQQAIEEMREENEN